MLPMPGVRSNLPSRDLPAYTVDRRDPAEFYLWLAPDAANFDCHVGACIFALALSETATSGRSLSETTGLDSAQIHTLARRFFAHAERSLLDLSLPFVAVDPDEACLRDLLGQCCAERSDFALALAAMVARRAQSPNHLWQDLGLANRGELSQMMARHFPRLAARNTQDMKWKKFLYRTICRDAAYQLCTAPSCAECDDFEVCFGDESGESRLARIRRAGDVAVQLAAG